MSYATGEALILAQIVATSSFTANTATRGNFNILDMGYAQTYAILVPGPFEHYEEALGGMGKATLYGTRWTTICQVWTIIKDNGASLQDMGSKRDAIISRFDQYRKAGDSTGNVRKVRVESGGDPFEIVPQGSIKPIAYRQDLNIIWEEESNVTLAE